MPDGSGGSTWDVNFDFGNHNAKLIQLLNYSSIAKLIWAGSVFCFFTKSFRNNEFMFEVLLRCSMGGQGQLQRVNLAHNAGQLGPGQSYC